MTVLEGHQSKPEEVYASARNMALLSFINSGLMIQIVYFQFLDDTSDFGKTFGLKGTFKQFNQEWYIKVGSTITI